MYGIIYKITCAINKKIYIGLTTASLHKRLLAHYQRAFKGETFFLCRAIRKYGKESFIAEQIDQADSLKELNEKEIFWIKFYDSINPKIGYNEKEGGGSAPLTNKIKEKIRNSQLGRKASIETRQKMSRNRKGKKKALTENYKKAWTEERKKQNSEMVRKEKNAMYGLSMLQRIQNKWGIEEGQKRYKEWRKKIKELHITKHSGKNNPMAGISPLQRLINKYGEEEGKKRYEIWKSKTGKKSWKIKKEEEIKKLFKPLLLSK